MNHQKSWKQLNPQPHTPFLAPVCLVVAFLALLLALLLSCPVRSTGLTEATFFTNHLPVSEDKPFIEKTMIVSAYNAGIEWQNDDTPCISASNENICELLEQGEVIFASRHYFGKHICVEGIGCGRVADKMNIRYGKNYLDWAMPADKIAEARQFGRQNLKIKIYD